MDAAYRVRASLGPGLLGSAYEAVLAFELEHKRLGLLLNFNVAFIKDGNPRIANGMPD